MRLCAVTPTYLTLNRLGSVPPASPCPRGFLDRLFCGPDAPVYQSASAYTSTSSGVPGSSSTLPPTTSGGHAPPFVPTPEPVLVIGNDVWDGVWQALERMPRITLVRND